MSNSNENLQQDLNAELSRLIRKYEDEGLGSEEIGDALAWHSTLAASRQSTYAD